MGLFGSKKPSGPPRPHERSFAGWEAPSFHAQVDDSLELQEAFEILFAGYNVEDYNGAEYDDWAYLVREPNNSHDYCATSVWVGGQWVGRLDSATAARYVVEMNCLEAQGMNLVVPAHLWAQRTRSRLANRVTLLLPAPGAVGPANKFPKKAFTILPPGEEVPLMGFEDHIDVLRPLISTGREVSIAIILRLNGERVDCYLDKAFIGCLSPVQSEKIAPLVRRAQNAKFLPVARGVLAGSDVATDMWMLIGGTDYVGESWMPSHDGGR